MAAEGWDAGAIFHAGQISLISAGALHFKTEFRLRHMNALSHETKHRWARVLLTTALVSASLWDFRAFEIRIFDAAAIVLLLGYFTLSPENYHDWLWQRIRFIPLFAVIIIYAILGYLLHQHRSSIAIIALSLVGLQLIGRNDWLWSTRILKSFVIAHVGFFLVQIIAYRTLGVTIYLHSDEYLTRFISSPDNIRGTGLMQEANSYCLHVFVLTTLVILHRPNRVLVFFVATTMMLSESLWGIGASIMLIFLHEFRNSASIKKFVGISCAIILSAGMIFNIVIWANIVPGEKIPTLYSRIGNIVTDTSLQERYIRNSCVSAEPNAANLPVKDGDSEQRKVFNWIVGEGLTTAYFLNCLALNGLIFLLKSFGALGLLALILSLGLALRGLTSRDKFFVLASLAFSFTTYPLMTYLIFWIWLPLLIRLAAVPTPRMVTQ